eukprot:COSAG06_NODE_28537_length_572_cov_1.348837_1_plen_74_part_01
MQKLEQEVRMLRAEEEAIIREYTLDGCAAKDNLRARAREARHERDQQPPASPATRQDLDRVLTQATSGMNGEWR